MRKVSVKYAFYLRKHHWQEVKQKLWGEHFWSPSNCITSCGGAPLEIVKASHASGELVHVGETSCSHRPRGFGCFFFAGTQLFQKALFIELVTAHFAIFKSQPVGVFACMRRFE